MTIAQSAQFLMLNYIIRYNRINTDFRSPRLSIPTANWIAPDRNVRATAQAILLVVSSGSSLGPQFHVSEAVKRERMAVGPNVMSLLVPKMVYMKQPMNAEYSPYCSDMKCMVPMKCVHAGMLAMDIYCKYMHTHTKFEAGDVKPSCAVSDC